MKRCSKCGEVKPLSEFYKKKGGKDGLCSICKLCEKVYRKQYCEQNRERESARKKQYYEQNIERALVYGGQYREKKQLSKYKNNAKRRNFEWDLTDGWAFLLLSMPCYYGGDHPGGGIDRVDSKKGYTFENCVPCCSRHNFMKGVMSLDEFVVSSLEVATMGAGSLRAMLLEAE